MIRAGLVGLGKMGISHYAIVNSHPDVRLTAVCDTSKFLLGMLQKHVEDKAFHTDYKEMIDAGGLDCVFVSTPTSSHAEIVKYAIGKGLHVFVEKPLCETVGESRELAELAARKGIVNQVGYHNRFIGVFREAKRLVEAGAIGDVYHFLAEAYGPVVVRPTGSTWRFKKSEGGGCLHDYASHVIDLVGFVLGPPDDVESPVLKSIYSADVEDAVFATFKYRNGRSGQLSVNWSDETHRKMTTQLEIWGTEGKIIADRQECKIYIKRPEGFNGLSNGWTIKYITELTDPVAYYLRGEEYSAQVDYFVQCIRNGQKENINSFASAAQTDAMVDRIAQKSRKGA